MAITGKEQVKRLSQRIAVLEARNANLRAEVERLTHGEQPRWTRFEAAPVGVFGDGRMIDHNGSYEVFVNSRYQVAIFEVQESPIDCRCVHVSIKRIDGAACRDWRDFQRIKNELIGPEAEAVELYPAESRCVDGANQYHLHAIIGKQWPIGFRERLVSEDQSAGVTQRPFADDQKPTDLEDVSAEKLAAFAGLEE